MAFSGNNYKTNPICVNSFKKSCSNSFKCYNPKGNLKIYQRKNQPIANETTDGKQRGNAPSCILVDAVK